MCYNQPMKRLTVFIICILLLASGCAKKEEKASLFAVDPLNGGTEAGEAALPGPKGIAGLEAASAAEPASTADPEAAPSPAVAVTGTAAYVFDGAEGPTLYGAAAYENTGNCPVIITNAALSFNVGGTAYQYSFVPIMNDKTVVLPGETSFVAFWHKDSSLTPGTAAAMTASLDCAKAEGRDVTVYAKDIFLADNYPGFTTMTGTLSSDGECDLNLVYIGFYDSSDNFIGVWHFTKNAPMDGSDSKSFSIHMKELPIDGLAEKAASVKVIGIGF